MQSHQRAWRCTETARNKTNMIFDKGANTGGGSWGTHKGARGGGNVLSIRCWHNPVTDIWKCVSMLEETEWHTKQ